MQRKITAVRFVMLALLLVLVRGRCSGQAQPPSLVTLPDNKPVSVKQVYGESYALLIGVDAYPGMDAKPTNMHALADVTSLKKTLVNSYGFTADNVTTLTGKDATLETINGALGKLADQGKIKPEDRILIYFSGLARTVALPTLPAANGGDMGFLLAADATGSLTDAMPPKAGLSMAHLWEQLDASPARHALVLVDACYSGLLARPRPVSEWKPEALSAWKERKGREILVAGHEGEPIGVAPPDSSPFASSLLDELNSRAADTGKVFTAAELYIALRLPVLRQTRGTQSPQFAQNSTNGGFLFITAGAPKFNNPHVVMEVEGKGKIEIELLPGLAPKTVAHFLELIDQKFYDGILFHRVEAGFVAQTGDPASKKVDPAKLRGLTSAQIGDQFQLGAGGSGKTVPLEVTAKTSHDRGTVGLARSQDPDSGDSQFFFNLAANHPLDSGYCEFGKVVKGLDVMDALKNGDRIKLFHRAATP